MHVDMPRIRVRYGILCQLYCTLVALENLHAWYAVSRKNKTLHVRCKKGPLGTLRHGRVFGLRGAKRNAFLRPRNQLTAAPPHITTPPDTDLRSVSLLAPSASANASKSYPEPR